MEHIIRASAGNADCEDIIIIGSQAILGSYPDAPASLLRSMKADVFPLQKPEDAILIDGAIGELSLFHATFGYYAHGVAEDTAILPEDWKSRLVPIKNVNTRGCTGWCLEMHDLAVAKLIAGREKDMVFLTELLRPQLIDPDLVSTSLTFVTGLSPDRLASVQARWKRGILSMKD